MSNVVSIDPRNALSFSSFGEGADPDAMSFRPRSILHGDRWRELDFKGSYYKCSQHDAKIWDFDGRVVGANPRSVQPLISSEKSPTYIPLNMRKPSNPVRLGKAIVASFTNLIFGESRFPTIKVEGDEEAQDFAQTIARVGDLPSVMIRARNLGGSMGTVGISWCFHEGLPRFEAHDAKNLYVHSWLDRLKLKPRHVTEVYLHKRQFWDGKGFNWKFFWFRRDWTPNGDFVFKDVPFEKNRDPIWDLDEEKSNRHGEGRLHFEWVQNEPTDEIDGEADYDGLYEKLDQLDILSSVVNRGGIANLDPTLKLKMDPDLVNRSGVKKGSDNAIITGVDGDAEYMELAGTSVDAGLKLMAENRRSILETAQCVIADPNEVAAQGTSSVAMKMMYSPMLARVSVLREQYAKAMTSILSAMSAVARERMAEPIEAVDPQTQETAPARFVLALPPKVEEVEEEVMLDQLDPATGQTVQVPSGEIVKVPREVPRSPGRGGDVTLVWPAFFPPTHDDQQKIVGAMTQATGGKAFISVETAADITAVAFGVDPAEERRRLEAEAQTSTAQTEAMFPPIGGGSPPGQASPPQQKLPPLPEIPEEKPPTG